jgi:hypothetical protein
VSGGAVVAYGGVLPFLHMAEQARDGMALLVLSALTQCSITLRSPRSETAKPY